MGQVRIIFQPIWEPMGPLPTGALYLVYAQQFDIIPQFPLGTRHLAKAIVPEVSTGMYFLCQALHADNVTCIGGVIALTDLAMEVELLTYHGSVADRQFTHTNSLECSTTMLLNHFAHAAAHAILREELAV